MRWNLTFALVTYWNTGSSFWLSELEDEIGWANANLKMEVFPHWEHPLITLE